MSRLIPWWIGAGASVVLIVTALGNQSGTCVDSAVAAASSCTSDGFGGLVLIGLAAFRAVGLDAQACVSCPASKRPMTKVSDPVRRLDPDP